MNRARFEERRKMGALGRIGLPEGVRNKAAIEEGTPIDIYYDALRNHIILVPDTVPAVDSAPELSYADPK